MNDIHLPHWLVVASWTVAEVCRHPLTPGASAQHGAVEGETRYREYAQVRRARRAAATGAYMTDRTYGLVLHTQCINRAMRRRTRVISLRALPAEDYRSIAAATSGASGVLYGGDRVDDRENGASKPTRGDGESTLALAPRPREDTQHNAFYCQTRSGNLVDRRVFLRREWDGTGGDAEYVG